MKTRSKDFTGWSTHSKTEKLSGNLEPQANQRFVEFVYPGRLGRKSSTRVDSGSRQTWRSPNSFQRPGRALFQCYEKRKKPRFGPVLDPKKTLAAKSGFAGVISSS